MKEIFIRRSIRQFNSETVSETDIKKLLSAGMQAPSAGNQQPWEFIVVRSKHNLEALSNYNPYASCLKNANLAIIVLGNKNRMKYPEYYEQDLGACTQNILLEATFLNLGAVWLGCAPNENRMDFITNLYNLDESILPFCVIALGHPKNIDDNRFIDRFDEDRIKYIK